MSRGKAEALMRRVPAMKKRRKDGMVDKRVSGVVSGDRQEGRNSESIPSVEDAEKNL
jgi:hypothetical protein